MKKMFLFSLVMAAVGFATAQTVTTTDFVTNYSTYKGKSVCIKDVSGVVIDPTAVNAASASSGSPAGATGATSNLPTATAGTGPVKTTTGTTVTKKTGTTAAGVTTCIPPKGYSLVDFTFNTNGNGGCFYIVNTLVKSFNDLKATGKKMIVCVEVSATSKVSYIKGMDTL